MPTERTISAREAGVFLVGMDVKHPIRGRGVVAMPTAEEHMGHEDDEVFICWRYGPPSWVPQSELSYWNRSEA